ncbi:MAG: hypothetical protein ACKOHK_12565 [Planctomycetia bacterium]
MIQKLRRHGDDLALVFNREMLAAHGIDEQTPLDVSVIGTNVSVTARPAEEPAAAERKARFERALESTLTRYEKTLRRLAE